MLRYLRENTGNWIIKIFLGIIVIVFVFLGVGSMNASRQNEVASINDTPITVEEFQNAYKRMVDRMRAQFGNALNDDLLKALNVKQQALNSLINQKLLDMEAEKLKIVVSDEELQDTLMGIKAFQTDGAFNLDLYKRILGQQRMTPESFEAFTRQDLKNGKLRQMILSGITVSDAETRDWYIFENTKMAVNYLEVDPTSFTDVFPTQDAIKKEYEDNPTSYQSQPKLKVAYLKFSPEDHNGDAGVSQEQVKAFYEQNTARYSTPEKVEASHILIKVAEDADEAAVEAARKEAEAVYEKAAKGENFADLAKEFSQGPSGPTGGYLGAFERNAMVKSFGDAAFALNAGEISKPVKTQFGWHIIKVSAKHPASVTPFETAAADIRKELEGQEMQNQAYYKAGEAFDAVVDGDDFEQVALITKKPLMHTQAFTSDGTGLDSVELENPAEFARAAFALKNDEISEVQQLGDDYYLIRITERIEPKALPFDAVKDEIEGKLTAQLQEEAAQKKAEALLEKARAGKSLAELAQENDLKLSDSKPFTRNQSVPGIPGSQAIAKAAFGLTGENPVAAEVFPAGAKFYLISFKEKSVPDASEAEENQDRLKQELVNRKQQQYYTAWVEDLKSRADIQYDPKIFN
ncbi:MAG TPA: parvulin peptidyl-prolyl isomerase [Desulfobacteraceae bacterium]|nr:parvulin peptidyl-prolyl isomerase [Desulfobacteraceae bacterium]